MSKEKSKVIPQLETLASDCLADLAVAYRDLRPIYRLANRLLQQALSLTGSEADCRARCYFVLGDIYRERKKHVEAMEAYRQAIEINPEKIEFRASLALAAAEAGEKETRRTPKQRPRLGMWTNCSCSGIFVSWLL